jgi:hypothetical protein
MPSANIDKLIKAVNDRKHIPANACSDSTVTKIIGEVLARGKQHRFINEDKEYAAECILRTVLALYEAREEIEIMKAKVE